MRTIEAYTLAELKNKNPQAYTKVHKRWQELCLEGPVPWQDEIMDSLKAVVAACGGTMYNWQIGAYSPSFLHVKGIDDTEWNIQRFKDDVLAPNGCLDIKGNPQFVGSCVLNGYCADDDFLEALWKHYSSNS